MNESRYLDQLHAMWPNVSPENQDKADELIERLADVLDMMDECKRHINQEGCAVVQSRGTYTIIKENPYSKIYDVKHKLMLSTFKALDTLCPPDMEKRDELMEFLEADAG